MSSNCDNGSCNDGRGCKTDKSHELDASKEFCSSRCADEWVKDVIVSCDWCYWCDGKVEDDGFKLHCCNIFCDTVVCGKSGCSSQCNSFVCCQECEAEAHEQGEESDEDDSDEEEEDKHICGETGGEIKGLIGCGGEFDYQDMCMIENTSFCVECYAETP